MSSGNVLTFRRIRAVLGTGAIVAVMLALVTGGIFSRSAYAQGEGQGECPEGTVFLGNVEGDGGTITTEDGEIVVTFTGSTGSFSGDLEVAAVVVKAGENFNTVTFDPAMTEGEFASESGQDISNVTFCGPEEAGDDAGDDAGEDAGDDAGDDAGEDDGGKDDGGAVDTGQDDTTDSGQDGKDDTGGEVDMADGKDDSGAVDNSQDGMEDTGGAVDTEDGKDEGGAVDNNQDGMTDKGDDGGAGEIPDNEQGELPVEDDKQGELPVTGGAPVFGLFSLFAAAMAAMAGIGLFSMRRKA